MSETRNQREIMRPGMTREEIDRLERKDLTPGLGPKRPVDAATLILLDRRGGVPHVLLGRRHSRHAFMPDKFVFPGGRTDPTDARISAADELSPLQVAKLTSGPGRRISPARARAVALSAIRETYEEAGILIGQPGRFSTANPAWKGFADHGVVPSLSGLRFVARATTPPGRVRRFDTRFLATFTDHVALTLEGGGPTEELAELVWLPIEEAMDIDLPRITLTILTEVHQRLAVDPDLSNEDHPVPIFRFQHNRFHRYTV